MMDKKEHVDYWVKQAQDDWITVEALFKAKRYIHSLFFAHLVLEKLCKAQWIKDNDDNYPPKHHNLVYILSKTKLKISIENSDFLLMFNTFQLEGRYPDYKQNIAEKLNKNKTSEILFKVNEIKTWLINRLQ